MLLVGVLIKVMSTEGYRFENHGLKVHPERVSASRMESIPLFERGSEFGVQTLSRRVGSQEQGRYTSYGARNEEGDFRHGLGKTAQVVTLAIVELLASATAVVAGGVVAAGGLHFPFAVYTLLAMGAPIPFGVVLPITLSVIGIGLIVVGVKRIGAATRRVRSLF